jgi:hypothetical protein
MGSKGSTTTSSYKPPAEVMDAYRKATQMGYAASQQPFQSYGGEMVAGLNPTQISGIQNVNNAQGAALPFYNAATQYATQAARPISAGDVNQYMSPYLSNVAAATQANILEQNAQQQQALKSGAIQQGAFGGDRSGIAMSELARQQGLAGGANMANVYNTGYNQAMSGLQNQYAREAGTASMLQGLGGATQQSMLSGAQAQMAAGAQQQATQQAYDQAMYNQFLQQQAYPFQMAQYFANIAEGIGAGAGGTGTQTMPGPNVGSQLLGFGTAMASIPWSDERLKENIEPVGKTHDGQNIYKYNFKGSPKTEIGLIAQEVEGRHPEAVSEIGGLKAVDYNKAIPSRHHKMDGGTAYMGGVVAPSMERQHFAQGGLGMIPYQDFSTGMSYVPSGETEKHMKPGSTLPDPPKAAQDTGLDDTWAQIRGMSDEQKAAFSKNLKGLYGDVTETLFPDPTASEYRRASGGMVRHGYADAGVVPSIAKEEDDTPVVPAQGGVVPPPKPEPSPFLNDALNMVLRHEGGLLEKDTNGTPTNFGINQAAHPNIDVKKLTQDEARNIYVNDYWKPINGDVLAAKDPNLAKVALDISVTSGPGRARQLIAQSGGDPQKLLGLYSDFLGSLVQKNPERYGDFAGPWHNRMQSLSKEISAQPTEAGLGNVVVNPTADTPEKSSGIAGLVSNLVSSTSQGVKPGSNEHKRNLIERITNSDMSPDMQRALMSAGFAMMAGRSPFFGVNLGEAGKVGMQTYYNQQMLPFEQQKIASEVASQRAQAQAALGNVDVARIGQIRQLYMAVLPMIQFYKAEGKPLPPEYQSIQDEAMRAGIAGGASMAAPAQGTTAPTPVPSGVTPPPSDGTQPSTGVAPPPAAASTAAPALSAPSKQIETSSAPSQTAPATQAETPAQPKPTGAAEIFNQLPDDQNPYKLYEKAGRATTADLRKMYLDQANALWDRYGKNGIKLPNGETVAIPGSQELAARGAALIKAEEAQTNSVQDTDKSFSELQSGFGSRHMMLDGLAETLKKAETGAFAEFKSTLINTMASLGIAGSEEIDQAVDVQTAMKFFANSILDSGMKDKIGPQISNVDLKLVAKGQGSVQNLAKANRNIIGAMLGKLAYDEAKTEAWDDFVASKGGTPYIKTNDVRKWLREFDDKGNTIKEFVEEAKANTPVAGELVRGVGLSHFHEGWKYIDPNNGKTFIFKGRKQVGDKIVPDTEYID